MTGNYQSIDQEQQKVEFTLSQEMYSYNTIKPF